jgi:hypothetical protein
LYVRSRHSLPHRRYLIVYSCASCEEKAPAEWTGASERQAAGTLGGLGSRLTSCSFRGRSSEFKPRTLCDPTSPTQLLAPKFDPVDSFMLEQTENESKIPAMAEDQDRLLASKTICPSTLVSRYPEHLSWVAAEANDASIVW